MASWSFLNSMASKSHEPEDKVWGTGVDNMRSKAQEVTTRG